MKDNKNERNEDQNKLFRTFNRGNVTVTVTGVREMMQQFSLPDIPVLRVEIRFRSTSGKEVTLNDLLPSGWKIVQSGSFLDAESTQSLAKGPVTRPSSKIVEYPRHSPLTRPLVAKLLKLINLDPLESASTKKQIIEKSLVSVWNRVRQEKINFDHLIIYELHDFLMLKGAFITLLHEIGHAHEPEYEAMPEDRRKLREESIILKYKKRDEFTEADKKTWSDYVISAERDAWAFAVRAYRKLRSEGIDVEPDLNLEGLFEVVHDALGTYELKITEKSK